MSERIPGIHHVTAIASDPTTNLAFHTEVLGLRLVKRTVNFDDPGTYHLYFGDEVGTPGTVMTFFPFGEGRSGRVGRGQPSATAFLVPEGSLPYWEERFDKFDVAFEERQERFGAQVLTFTDHDGQPYELVTGENDVEPWADAPIPAEHAIRGFFGVTLDSLAPRKTESVLETMGYEQEGKDGERTRLRAAGERATVVDVLDRPDGARGSPGPGTVHHVAFRTPDDDSQAKWQETIRDRGLNVTDKKDRQYFRSIYFREQGGILFEIATEGPGFAVDEDPDELGSALQLPPWLEDDRDAIERQLPSLEEQSHETQMNERQSNEHQSNEGK